MNGHLGDRAAAYVDGVLDASEVAEVRAHLVGCAACRTRVAEQERVRDLLRGAGVPGAGPRPDLLAVLAAMPVAGVPPTGPAGVPASRAALARRGAVCCLALGATVMATAWVAGGQQVAAAGPPAVAPGRLLAQHSATAGQLPFWGAHADAVAAGSAGTDPVQILRRAAQASSSLDYRAVEEVTVYAAGTPSTAVAEVSHIAGRGTSTRTLAPAQPVQSAAFQPQVVGPASSSEEAVALLSRSYHVELQGTETVAGRPADRLAVRAASGELVARFWIDRSTGLPLARETRTGGSPVVDNRMTSVSVADTAVMPEHLPVATSTTWGEAVGLPADESLEVMQAKGWVCPDDVGRATGLTAFDVLVGDADASGSQGPVLHVIYTDGLQSLSVFQQHAALSPDRLTGFRRTAVGGQPVYRRESRPAEITWASGSTVFTVVGDVPDAVLDSAVAALPHEPTAVGSRAGRGFARVGSWLDPFG